MRAFVIHMLGESPQVVAFDTPPVRIGRDPENDVVLSDRTVSREHAIPRPIPHPYEHTNSQIR